MYWIKVLSLAISCLLWLVNGLPTSVLLDSKAAALKSGEGDSTDTAGGHGALLSATTSSLPPPSVSGEGETVKRAPKKRGAVLPQSSTETEFWPYLLNQQRQEHRQQNSQDAERRSGGFWSDLEDGYFDGPASGRGGMVGSEGGRGFYDNYYGYAPFGDADQEQAEEDEEIAELINSREGFSEPVAMPVLYSPKSMAAGLYGMGRGLGVGGAPRGGYRKKRSNKRSHKSFRLKRDNNRMDAAEALALLQLIEAQEKARHRPVKEDYYNYLFSNGGENNPDEEVWMNSRTDPTAHFFTPPSTAKHSAYESNFYGLSPAKRFMVAKRKKRSSARLI